MNKDQVRKYCISMRMGQKSISKKKGWVQLPCPLAPWNHKSGKDKNPSFGVYVHPRKKSKAHCFSCGFGGDLHDLLLEIKHKSKNDKEHYDFKTAMQLIALEEEGGGLEFAFEPDEDEQRFGTYYFDEDWLTSFRRAGKCEEALDYLEKRQVPKWVRKELGLRYDSYEKRVCFPVRDFEGKLVGLHGRAISNNTPPPYRMYTYNKRNNPQCWYGEDKIDLEKPVVIVESVFDYARVYEVYKNVICPLTAEVTKEKVERLGDMLFGILMMDGDQAGKRGAFKIKKFLPHVKFKTIDLPDGKDPGSMSKGEIAKMLKKHLKSNLLSN